MNYMKKLFSATFEQSLDLLDDQLVVYMINKGDPKLLRHKPWINTFFSVLIFVFCYLISRLYYHQDFNSPVGVAKINLFPSWTIYIFFSYGYYVFFMLENLFIERISKLFFF